jgi:hypothetical protein
MKTVYLLYRIQRGIDWSERDQDILEGATLSKKKAISWVDSNKKETKRKKEMGFTDWKYDTIGML